MVKPKSFWKKYPVKVNQTLGFKAGYAEVFIKHVSNGWLVKTGVLAQPAFEMEVSEANDLCDDQNVRLQSPFQYS